MLISGDVVRVDLGIPAGSEPGLARPAVVVTAQRVVAQQPTVVQIVPLTRTLRGYASEVRISADEANGLAEDSAAQCQHMRAVSASRLLATIGNVGPVVLAQVRDTLALLLDL